MKASQLTLLPEVIFGNSIFELLGNNQKAVNGIRDPYSNKIYGGLPYDQLLREYTGRQSQLQTRLLQGVNTFAGNTLDIPVYRGMADYANPNPPATMRETLSAALSSFFIPNKEDYVYQDKMVESYNAYGADWDSYFKGNYQNPRIAEDQRNKAAKDKQQFSTAQAAATTGALSADNLGAKSKRSVGTGVGTSTFNPFGAMEAGIGL